MKSKLHIPRSAIRIRGSVLIIVMWVSLGLVSLALLFGHSMVLEYRAADGDLAGFEAEQALEAARRYIALNWEKSTLPGRQVETADAFLAENVAVGEARWWIVGRGADEANPRNELEFGVIDEAAKLNLNVAPLPMIEALPGMTLELAAAIVDWRDADSELTPNGAESDYYLQRDPPYSAKNAPFESVEELLLLSGATWELLVGEDLNRNGVLDPNENDGDASPPRDNADGRLDFGIFEYVTVVSGEAHVQPDGTPRVDIRQNQELTQLLVDAFGQERADEIQRLTGTDLTAVRSVLEYYIMTRITPEEFAKIDDRIAVGDDEFTTGLINVNTAPAGVLTCVPGIGAEYAQTLAAKRATLAVTDLESLAWVAEVLPQENALAAGTFITSHMSQFAADVVATGRYGRGMRRARFTFDVSRGGPPVVQRQDWAYLGWPLGAEIRAGLKAEGERR